MGCIKGVVENFQLFVLAVSLPRIKSLEITILISIQNTAVFSFYIRYLLPKRDIFLPLLS